MEQRDDGQIVSIFEEAVRELLEFHCNNNFPFYKEAEAQAWLYMSVYEKLKRKRLLFHKCDMCKEFSDGRLIIRLLPKYQKENTDKDKNKKQKYADFAITAFEFCPYNDKATKENQTWKNASDNDYLIMVEIKSWNNYSEADIKKLSDSRAQNKYFILLGDEYKKNKDPEATEDILTPTGSLKPVYTLNETSARIYKDCNIYYGLIYSKDGFEDTDHGKVRFEWTRKGKLHVYANKGLIKVG